MTIHILSGPPGSGKTTLAKQLTLDNQNTILHSYDDIPGANTFKTPLETVKQTWLSNIKQDLKAGNNVVIDATNLTVDKRLELLSEFKDFYCDKILHVLNTPLETCLERNSKREGRSKLPDFVVRSSYEMFQPPTKEEGWNDIIYY